MPCRLNKFLYKFFSYQRGRYFVREGGQEMGEAINYLESKQKSERQGGGNQFNRYINFLCNLIYEPEFIIIIIK